MTPQEYAERKAAPRGSSLYYSIHVAPRSQQNALRALYAYQREVTEIVREVSDPAVAKAKLRWWREELERTFAGQPQHPVGKALFDDLLPRMADAREPLFQVIDGVDMDLDYGLYPSVRELVDYCHRVGGGITRLAVRLCSDDTPELARYAHDLGMALQLFTLLRRVRRDLDAGRLYIPETDLQEAGVSQSDLLQHRTTDAVRQLFAMQAARIRDFFSHAFEHLPPGARYQQRSGIVLARLYQAQLDEMETEGYPLLERGVHLTPIRKYWIAWRTAREQRQYRKSAT